MRQTVDTGHQGMEEKQQGGLRGLNLMSSQAKSVTIILSGMNSQSVWILGDGISSNLGLNPKPLV